VKNSPIRGEKKRIAWVKEHKNLQKGYTVPGNTQIITHQKSPLTTINRECK
jgi:hypothetical protein